MPDNDTQPVARNGQNGSAKPNGANGNGDNAEPSTSSGVGKWILLAVLVLVAIGGFFVYRYNSVRESTDDAQIEGHVIPVSARVGGSVTRVNYDENQYVEAGAVLIELDPKDYQVALDKAQADLADALAQAQAANVDVPKTSTTSSNQLSAAQATVAANQSDVTLARAHREEAEANLARVAADLKRMEMLVAKDEVSRQQYDAAVAAEKSARATVEAMNASIATAENKVAQAKSQERSVNTVPEQVAGMRARAAAAEAMVARARATVERARLDLEYAIVRAPASGIVSKKSIEPGQIISAGQSIMAVVPTDDIWVVANFKENQLKSMHVGQSVTLRVDAYGKDYEGKVDSIGGATSARFSVLPPENSTGNYVKVVQRVPVKLVFEKGQDKDHLLRPGMSVVPTVMIK